MELKRIIRGMETEEEILLQEIDEALRSIKERKTRVFLIIYYQALKMYINPKERDRARESGTRQLKDGWKFYFRYLRNYGVFPLDNIPPECFDYVRTIGKVYMKTVYKEINNYLKSKEETK